MPLVESKPGVCQSGQNLSTHNGVTLELQEESSFDGSHEKHKKVSSAVMVLATLAVLEVLAGPVGPTQVHAQEPGSACYNLAGSNYCVFPDGDIIKNGQRVGPDDYDGTDYFPGRRVTPSSGDSGGLDIGKFLGDIFSSSQQSGSRDNWTQDSWTGSNQTRKNEDDGQIKWWHVPVCGLWAGILLTFIYFVESAKHKSRYH